MLRKNKEPYSSFYKILGFYPDDIHLYEQAFLHKSSSVEVEKGKWLNNERMEFLGDAILDAIVADVVYTCFPSKREGFLTNTRSKIVSRETLNRVATELGLDKFIVYSIKLNNHNKCIYGNALEAFIAAIYLDQGYDVCKRFVCEKIIKDHLNIYDMAQKEVNFKSNLIEWSQKNKIDISFDLIESFTDREGNPVFQTQVIISGIQAGVGIGYSKKESQQNAAKMAVKKLRTDKEFQRQVIALKKRHREDPEARDLDEWPEEEHDVAPEPKAYVPGMMRPCDDSDDSRLLQADEAGKEKDPENSPAPSVGCLTVAEPGTGSAETAVPEALPGDRTGSGTETDTVSEQQLEDVPEIVPEEADDSDSVAGRSEKDCGFLQEGLPGKASV